MKIQCQSCQAKYTIADEKVLGKVVKIRCKKCSSTIVINGNETRPGGQDENAETHVFDYAGQANEPWTVNVADGDQRTMTGQEIVAEYKAGVVNDETYCWKDGMADWLPLREIEPLYAALKLGPGRPPQESLHDDISVPPQSIPPPASNAAALFAANEASAVDSPFAGNDTGRNGTNGNGLYGGGHSEPSGDARPAPAARRGGGRGQGADLFGNAASAGGEDDVMTSAAAGSPGGGGGGGGLEEHKLTGQRNESSVLFSLSALTEGNKPEPTNRTTATADGSGLIDIRALSQTMGADDKKDTNARVDDIMNLSGGGAFGAALAAPILAPPPLEMATSYGEQSGGQQKSNSTLIIAILAGAALIAIGIVVAVVLTRPTVPPIDASNTSPSSSDRSAGGMATPSASVASGITAPTASGTDTTAAAAGSAPGATADNTPAPPGTGNATGKAAAVTGAPTHNAATGPHAVADNTPPPPAATHAAAAPPQDFAGALAQAANKPAPTSAPAAPAAGGAPFDRGAASGAIGAVNVQSCAKPGGPTGSGHVKITFAPDGSVSSAVLDSGPFTGTPVGGCVAGKFRSPHVPAFSGGAITVGKSFSIN